MAISITIGEITVSHPVKWPSTLAPVAGRKADGAAEDGRATS
jgi:hypothetical protein